METLSARLARSGALPEADAVGWVIRVARSVEHIHGRLGEHGRLSADAILIEVDDCTSMGRLIDFADLPVTPAYHSPERTSGAGASQSDDTWALAVTLYFALSGNLPFSGATVDEMRRKIISVPAPPLAVFDVGDDTLQGIVERALSPNPTDRILDLPTLRADLESWLVSIEGNTGPAALPPLLGGDDLEEEVTMIQVGVPSALRKALEAQALAAKALAPPAPPPASAPEPEPPPPSLPPPASAPAPRSAPAPASTPAPASAPPPPSRAASSPPASAPPPPSQAAPAAPPRTGSTAGMVFSATLAMLGAGGVAYLLLGELGPKPPPAPPPPASVVTAAAPRPAAPPSAPPASAYPPASARAAPVASPPSPAAAPPRNLAACVETFFPADTFGASADFAFVCAEPDPIKGATGIRTELVRAHKNESEGMREWALLGWYELAAFAAVRGRCCASPPPIKLPEVPKSCAPVPEVLGAVDTALASAASVDDDRLKQAVDAYTHDVHCIVRTGLAARFGRVDNPQGGEDTAFKRFLGRVLQAAR